MHGILRTLTLSTLFMAMMTMSSTSKAQTGTFGFALGVGLGMAGVDISDGTDRINLGGVQPNLNFGFHTGPFVFTAEGTYTVLPGSLATWDSISDVGLRFKSYLSESWHLSLQGGVASYKRSTSNNTTLTLNDRGGWFGGAQIGVDLIAGQGNGYRLSFNVGAKRYDFGTQDTRQGVVTTHSDLNNRYIGMTYTGSFNVEWYL